MKRRRISRASIAIVIGSLILGGCVTDYSKKVKNVESAIESGDMNAAASSSYEFYKKHNSENDKLLVELEFANNLRLFSYYLDSTGHQSTQSIFAPQHTPFSGIGIGEENPPFVLQPNCSSSDALKASTDLFYEARRTLYEVDNLANVSVSEEATALLVNQTQTVYRGYHYDRIMAYSYMALNELGQGNMDEAGNLLRTMRSEQKASLERYAKELEKQAEEKKESEYDSDRALKDEKFANSKEQQYAFLDHFQPYGDMANPFSTWLFGVYFTYMSHRDDEMINYGKQFLERSYGMAACKNQILPDIEFIENVKSGSEEFNNPGVTYVLFENGRAPSRDQVRIDIPLFLVSDEINYVGIAFPTLKYHKSNPSNISVNVEGQTYYPELLCDMDRVISEEFEYELPMVITKTLLSAGAKALIDHKVKKQAKKSDGWAGIIAEVATTVYETATNVADTRTWNGLPKNFKLLRLKTPENGTISLERGMEKAEISLQTKTGVNFIIVRAVNDYSPFIINQFGIEKTNDAGFQLAKNEI